MCRLLFCRIFSCRKRIRGHLLVVPPSMAARGVRWLGARHGKSCPAVMWSCVWPHTRAMGIAYVLYVIEPSSSPILGVAGSPVASQAQTCVYRHKQHVDLSFFLFSMRHAHHTHATLKSFALSSVSIVPRGTGVSIRELQCSEPSPCGPHAPWQPALVLSGPNIGTALRTLFASSYHQL